MGKIKMAFKTFILSICLLMIMGVSVYAKTSNDFTVNNHKALGTCKVL